MRIIGVTGGIGSGKSTVSKILEGFGAMVIDADKIAREIVGKGCKALDELVNHFGQGILDINGELDRKKLAAVVFNNQEKLDLLNSITHKYVVEKIFNDIDKIKSESKPYTIVLDVPIPVEHGFFDTVDEVWVVFAQKDVRISRIMARSGLLREEAESRINSQMSDKEYIKLADKIIYNNDSLEDLKNEIKVYYYTNRD